ncbi:MAG: HD domain-containing protein [Candidatus Calescibacterium sp.]|nr:HD domain-containing protein [Candidatus Calescibacterium sp.]MDW8132458.1 HD domain-containing protein [Candidatus Calescibacterium sp.]
MTYLKQVLYNLERNPKVLYTLQKANSNLKAWGYTEHGIRHAKITSQRSMYILQKLSHAEEDVYLAGIAGFLHDIGNVVSRANHEISSSFLSMEILKEMNVKYEHIIRIMSAIGSHEDNSFLDIPDNIAAALVIADKSDVHRSRVQNTDIKTFDIHDRVNYAVERDILIVNKNHSKHDIILDLKININYSSIIEYFEIFLHRMKMCKRSAEVISSEFYLIINGQRMA